MKDKVLQIIPNMIEYIEKIEANEYLIDALYEYFVNGDIQRAVWELMEIDEFKKLVKKELEKDNE